MRPSARRRELGQHFLVDRRAVGRIVAALDIAPQDAVLEIGPGRGALTSALLERAGRAGRVAAIELDPRLAAFLRRRFPAEALALIEGDVLTVSLERVAEQLDVDPQVGIVVAGNLPYSISKPVVQKLIRERGWIDRAVLMFQREVALRLTSAPGSRSYGPLTVLAGEAYEIRALFDLPPRAFRPPPRVESRVTLWRRRRDQRLDPSTESRLRRCLGVSFGRRRRTLRNNLLSGLGDPDAVDRLLARCELDGSDRAEQVPPAGFLRLARHWPDDG